MFQKIQTHSLNEFDDFVGQFADNLFADANSAERKNATIITLNGELGVGKTTFVQAVARRFGVDDVVVSPTFVIMKSYELKAGKTVNGFARFIHIDAYRLTNAIETKYLDWQSIIYNPSNIIFIEWASNIAKTIPSNAYHVSIEHTDNDNERIITVAHSIVEPS